MNERTFKAPEVNVETQPFWNAARAGKLLIKQCNSCEQPHYYPRALCPFCLSADTAWQGTTGEATLYTYSVMRRGPGTPFVAAYVTLDEGPTILTNLTDCDPDALAIGQRLTVRFTPTDDEGPPIPLFAPV